MKLGDFLEKLIYFLTLGQGKKLATFIAKKRGKEDCGCGRRKEKLNNLTMSPPPPIQTPKNNKHN